MDGYRIEKALLVLPPEAAFIVRVFQREHESLVKAVERLALRVRELETGQKAQNYQTEMVL